MKPQNIVEMLHLGSRDVGFAGADWALELAADLVELLDTGLDPVRLVAAATPDFAENGLAEAPFVVASEYERLTRAWLERRGLAGDLRALLRRDRGVPARGCRLHRRQHGDRRDAAGQRPGRSSTS